MTLADLDYSATVCVCSQTSQVTFCRFLWELASLNHEVCRVYSKEPVLCQCQVIHPSSTSYPMGCAALGRVHSRLLHKPVQAVLNPETYDESGFVPSFFVWHRIYDPGRNLRQRETDGLQVVVQSLKGRVPNRDVAMRWVQNVCQPRSRPDMCHLLLLYIWYVSAGMLRNSWQGGRKLYRV